MAATNLPDILDPALTRPGRFDRHVSCPFLVERVLPCHTRFPFFFEFYSLKSLIYICVCVCVCVCVYIAQ